MPFTLSASELAPATVEALEQCPRDSETGEMLLPMELLATLFIERSMSAAKPEAVCDGGAHTKPEAVGHGGAC